MFILTTGVNRAFPYAKLDPAELDQQLETMHKLVHLVSFNISIQALTLLYQVMDARESVTDRQCINKALKNISPMEFSKQYRNSITKI